MSASDDIRIAAVPPALLGDMMPHAAKHLARGLATSDVNLLDLTVDLAFGRAVLWCVFDRDGLTAAFLTSLHEDADGTRFLMLYGFGGIGLRRWLRPMKARLEAYARAENCTRVRFYGRPGWGRIVPDYKPVADENGAAIYERALA